ncbi:MAG: hypothetical protein WAV47_04900, partial [Blastocatellia bacterium]
HKGSLLDFEKLWPLVYHVAKQHPFYFYLFHNGLAVELIEAGRIEEAEAACSVALSSPFASAYPEWSETRDEIAAKRQSATQSVVAINRPREADPSQRVEPQRERKPLRVRAFIWPATNKDHFQISVIPTAPAAAITGMAQGILDWMRICIGPRAPPALS